MDKKQAQVLILDDREAWRQIFFELVADAGYDAILAENLISARNILKSAKPEIVILDLYLRKESDAHIPAEGLKLLKDISKLYSENKKGPGVIVFSGSPLSSLDYQEVFAYQNQGVVVAVFSKEKYDEEQFRDTLIKAVKTIQERSTDGAEIEIFDSDILDYKIDEQDWYQANFPATIETDFDQLNDVRNEIDVVLITANDEEIKAVMGRLEPYPRRKGILVTTIGPETYYLGKFGAYRTVVTKCSAGSLDEGGAILATNQAVKEWKPRVIIMVGIAFGKDSQKQKLADVLVASQIISYEQQRVGEKIIYRGSITPTNPTLLNRFKNVTNWRFVRPDDQVCEIQVGAILSGEKLVDDPEFKNTLFSQFPQAIGGEMEGTGLRSAAVREGTAWILVKSISDWGDGKKNNKHQPLAAAAATSLVHHVLSRKTALSSINKLSS